MPSPKISICIPTYQGETYLQEALDSILAQDFQDIEVIISDDASSDATLDIAERFKAVAAFPVHIHKHTPQGIGANWNHSVSLAKGEYIKFLFQDDVLLPYCLKKMSTSLDAHPELGMVSSKRTFIIEGDSETEELKRWLSLYSDLQSQFKGVHKPFLRLDKSIFSMESFFSSPLNKVGEPSVYMFRRSVFYEIGPFREDLKQILDYEFCYRLLKKKDIAILPDTLVAFRIHAAQATNVNRQVDIPDYRIYERLLYDEYRDLLHPSLRTKLVKKYHPFYILKDKVSLKLRLSMKKFFP
jgi:glycosyltransferase involved in cell wall biosynthesis